MGPAVESSSFDLELCQAEGYADFIIIIVIIIIRVVGQYCGEWVKIWTLQLFWLRNGMSLPCPAMRPREEVRPKLRRSSHTAPRSRRS